MSDKELLSYIQRIQQLMIDVSTGGPRIQDTESAYTEAYFKIAAELQDRECDNPNAYSSLWDYYSYWSAELPTYQSRREYIRELYKPIEDSLHASLARKQSRKASVKNLPTNYSLSFDDLHEDIVIKCKDYFLQEKYDDAVFNAYKLVEVKVREKSGLNDSDIGVSLMNKAFGPKQTNFIISDDDGEVSAWMHLFGGAIGAFKNPASHRFNEMSQQDAFQMIALASFLLSYADNLQVRDTDPTPINLDEIPF